MQQMNLPELELNGTKEEKEIAGEIWNLMRARGMLFAADRPITLSIEALADYFAGRKLRGKDQPAELVPILDKILSANPVVFLREEATIQDGEATRQIINFKTTKVGKAPVFKQEVDVHTFENRLNMSARAVEPLEEAAKLATTHAAPALNLPVAAPSPVAPAASIAPAIPVAPRPAAPVPPTIAPAQPKPLMPATEPVAAKPAATPTEAATVASKPPVAAPAPVASKPAAPAAPVVPATPVYAGPLEIEVASSVTADINEPIADLMEKHGDYFATALNQALGDDIRFVNFLSDWYIDEITGRYNKSDLRRIRDYMSEIQGPASDVAILADIWGKRPSDPDYEATRFALNYRLMKEKKDFEFVGVNEERVWSAVGLPQIGNPRLKATEIGTDYKFLEDATLIDPSEITLNEEGVKVWRHSVTFYEHDNGVLPLDASARDIFPIPLMEDQKSLVLQFEAPQNGISFTAELRYPTANRGGWVGGLETFFAENLVPGAIVLIRPNLRFGKTNQFIIEYSLVDEHEVNVLIYDDRRNKFVFRPIVLGCELDAATIITPERFPKIKDKTRMDDSDRKKTDQVIATSFEYAGQKTGQTLTASLDDLLPVVNIERPFSRAYLRHLLTTGNSMFQSDAEKEGSYTYKVPTSTRR